MKKSTLFLIFVLGIYLLTENFFDTVEFPFEVTDAIFVLGLLLIGITYNSFYFFLKNFKDIVLILIFLFLLNFLTSFINYNQPVYYSLKGGRFLVSYIIIAYISWLYVEKKRDIGFIPLIIPIVIIAINYYAYLTHDFSFFSKTFQISERYNDVRFMAAGTSVIYFTLYFFSRIEDKRFNILIFVLLFSIIIIMSKTRGIIFPFLILISISLFNKSFSKTSFFFKYTFVVLIIILCFFESKFFQNILHSYNSIITDFNSRNENNITFRFSEFSYYWKLLTNSPISIVFGNGLESEFTKSFFKERYFLSDLGIFKIIFYHGLIGLFLISYIIYKAIKLGNANIKNYFNNRMDIRLFIGFQLLSFATLTFFYKPTAIMFFFIIYFNALKIKNEMYPGLDCQL